MFGIISARLSKDDTTIAVGIISGLFASISIWASIFCKIRERVFGPRPNFYQPSLFHIIYTSARLILLSFFISATLCNRMKTYKFENTILLLAQTPVWILSGTISYVLFLAQCEMEKQKQPKKKAE